MISENVIIGECTVISVRKETVFFIFYLTIQNVETKRKLTGKQKRINYNIFLNQRRNAHLAKTEQYHRMKDFKNQGVLLLRFGPQSPTIVYRHRSACNLYNYCIQAEAGKIFESNWSTPAVAWRSKGSLIEKQHCTLGRTRTAFLQYQVRHATAG